MGKLEVKVQKKNLWLIVAMTIILLTLLYFNLNKGGKDIPLKHYNEIKTMRIHTNNVNIKTLDDKNEIRKILSPVTTLKEIKSLERHKNKEISMEIYTEEYKFETLVLGEDYIIFKEKYYGGKRISEFREEMEKYVITQDNIKEILKNLDCDIFAEDINYFRSISNRDYFKELFNGKTLEIREYDEGVENNWKFPRYKIVTNLDLNSSDDFDPNTNSLVLGNSYMTSYIIDENTMSIENLLGKDFTLIGDNGIYDIMKDNLLYVKNDERGDLYYLFNKGKVELKVEDKALDLTKHKDRVSEVLTGVIREDKESTYDYKDKSYTLWYHFEDNTKVEVKVYDNYVKYEGKRYTINNVLYTFEKLLKDIGEI